MTPHDIRFRFRTWYHKNLLSVTNVKTPLVIRDESTEVRWGCLGANKVVVVCDLGLWGLARSCGTYGNRCNLRIVSWNNSLDLMVPMVDPTWPCKSPHAWRTRQNIWWICFASCLLEQSAKSLGDQRTTSPGSVGEKKRGLQIAGSNMKRKSTKIQYPQNRLMSLSSWRRNCPPSTIPSFHSSSYVPWSLYQKRPRSLRVKS